MYHRVFYIEMFMIVFKCVGELEYTSSELLTYQAVRSCLNKQMTCCNLNNNVKLSHICNKMSHYFSQRIFF